MRLMETSMPNPVYLSIFIAWRIIIKTKLSIMLSFYTFNFYINKITNNNNTNFWLEIFLINCNNYDSK